MLLLAGQAFRLSEHIYSDCLGCRISWNKNLNQSMFVCTQPMNTFCKGHDLSFLDETENPKTDLDTSWNDLLYTTWVVQIAMSDWFAPKWNGKSQFDHKIWIQTG